MWLDRERNYRPSGRIHLGENLVPERRLVTTQFYTEWLLPQDLHHRLCAVLVRYNPGAPGPSPDMNFFPDGQAQNLANAYNNGNVATAGTPNGYHNGYTDLGLLAPDFGGNRDTNVFDCGPHGGCDQGSAPADQIQFPATTYITQPENCIRVIAGHELFHHVQYAYITFNNWPA